MFQKSHVAAFVLGAVVTVAVCGGAAPAPKPEHRFERLDVFARVLSYIESNYVEDVDEQALMYGAAKGMMHTLDPHSEFMTPDEFADMRAETDGEFGGIGIEIDDDQGVIVVLDTIINSPAAKAGLQTGDRIVAVDGFTSHGHGEAASAKLRGKPGTSVKIDVERKGWASARPFNLTRDLIRTQAVESELLEPGIGYIKIKSFQERTDEEVLAALEKIKAASGGRVQGLVLDLRGNPGGLFDQAVRVADLFLSSGVIVTTVGRNGKKLDEEVARASGTWEGFPITCLVNSGSASASEILAGALQDHGRALIVGTTTFGKGSVQSVFELADGSGLKLTVARYYTPNGRSIQEKGIVPDVRVEQLDSEKLKGAEVAEGVQRERDLEGHLKNPEAEKPPVASPANDMLAHDYQLRTAFQTLQSWNRFLKTAAVPVDGKKGGAGAGPDVARVGSSSP